MRNIERLHPELEPSPLPYEQERKFVLRDPHHVLTPKQKRLVILLARQRSYAEIAETAHIAYQTLKNELSHLIKTISQKFPGEERPTTSLEVILLLHKHGILKLVEPKQKK